MKRTTIVVFTMTMLLSPLGIVWSTVQQGAKHYIGPTSLGAITGPVGTKPLHLRNPLLNSGVKNIMKKNSARKKLVLKRLPTAQQGRNGTLLSGWLLEFPPPPTLMLLGPPELILRSVFRRSMISRSRISGSVTMRSVKKWPSAVLVTMQLLWTYLIRSLLMNGTVLNSEATIRVF